VGVCGRPLKNIVVTIRDRRVLFTGSQRNRNGEEEREVTGQGWGPNTLAIGETKVKKSGSARGGKDSTTGGKKEGPKRKVKKKSRSNGEKNGGETGERTGNWCREKPLKVSEKCRGSDQTLFISHS